MRPPPAKRDRSLVARLTAALAVQFVAVPTYFLQNYHRLRPHPGAKGMSNSEAMFVIHLLDHKWDERKPFPSQETLATRMGVSTRRIRQIAKTLKDTGYLTWDNRPYNSNAYDLTPLFGALEDLMRQDGMVVPSRDLGEEVAS